MARAATRDRMTPPAREPVVQSPPRERPPSASPRARPATSSAPIATQPAKWFLLTKGPKGLTVGTAIVP